MNTKEKILSSAMKLMLEKGFNEVSLNHIISDSGVSKGAFYHYFKSKDELFVELFNVYFFNYLDEFYAVLDNGEVPIEKKLFFLADQMVEIVDVYMKTSSNMGFYLIFFEAMSKFEDLKRLLSKHYNDLHDKLEQILEDGKSEGKIRPDVDSGAVSLQLISTAEGLMLMCMVMDPSDIDRKIKTIFENLWNGIKPTD